MQYAQRYSVYIGYYIHLTMVHICDILCIVGMDKLLYDNHRKEVMKWL